MGTKNVLDQHLPYFAPYRSFTNNSFQYLVDGLLDSIVYVFFSVQNHILLAYCMNGQELQPLRIVFLCVYSHDLIDVKVVTPSVVCIHLSAFVLSKILLNIPVITLWALLNLYCYLRIVLLFFWQFL